ncbi:MAG: RagB/SusD family nutrient uptake outer membrane protein [Bacteroidetes bacterium]|jgi:hypothetical protein|nr:RagB/SusD family nutrient uptake outer membrane protein [Bacteroidota bacterium]MBT4411051.1 RagB/SusD family nutrient uptake outer membrane protein [Bacteroidota bacterium]MBT5424735.1 RagB/SusD family nutrient uptake outer membrane protein [Bacteroidota bacterium]MBT7093131.1 RagB/SusD family nutrient uptake outer membrane protein [Bacteroidota bacterium]MBT7464887.1 RagB/SusD family nutrient uptake outer membrane protein [Bacteroidota bacterium]
MKNKQMKNKIMKKFKIYAVLLAAFVIGLSACMKDLNTEPIDRDEITSASVYENASNYYLVLAKLYAGLAVSGQQGPHGMPDISGIDEGFSTYVRQYWKAQELTTDEAIIAWNDGTIRDYWENDWSASSEFVTAMYNRIYYQISLVNEFIRESSDEKLAERDYTGATADDIRTYRAEARFLRALSYWHAMDMFGNVPFVTEEDAVGSFFPEQINRADLFTYVESELKDIENLLMAPTSNEYGRADQAAAWMLMAKLYLNAEVYIGTDKYSECQSYCQKIIDAGFSLEPEYAHLFTADNNLSDEIIFPVNFDGAGTRTWGGMTFVVHAAVGGSMNPADFGIDGGWGGTRVTKEMVKKFYPNITAMGMMISPKANLKSSYPVLYVPGSYSTPNWDPANSPTIASVNNDGNYEGYIWIADADMQWKYTDGPSWDVNWGDDGDDGTLELNGANLVSPETGYYKLNVNLNDMTHTYLKTEWGIIGDATAGGWDSDQDMTFDPETGIWTAILDLEPGTMKFRANDDWGYNLGDNGPDGVLNYDGANIEIPERGTYTITLTLGSPDYTYTVERGSFDGRAMFYTDGQTLEIEDPFEFTNGYAVTKFTNLNSDGSQPTDLTFIDTDFPLFRLADVYLMYAEAAIRTGSSLSQAVEYVNMVRTRAFGEESGNISEGDLSLEWILDERARELFWEGHRRTDLIRFGKFSGGEYLWPWKGGSAEGQSIDDKFNLFPIPASDMGANINLQQNPGY